VGAGERRRRNQVKHPHRYGGVACILSPDFTSRGGGEKRLWIKKMKGIEKKREES